MKKRQTSAVPAKIDSTHLQLLAVPEVAKLLSIGRTSVYALIRSGKLPTVKIGSATRIRALTVQRYIEELSQAS